ncbi:MAG: D-alanyl-D-alanine carboxypeptidase [Bacteroidales bacterium]|nr:D-alanyl-D-alanine carboxypeptidase [Bacteroidales bacterium]
MSPLGKILAPLALLLCAGVAGRTTATQKLLSEYAGKEPLRSGIVGVLAVRGADTLAQMNRSIKMVPASNMKLLTTGLALLNLGADWQFRTTLAYSGTIKDGVLEGDLYIVGGGDPTTAAQTPCADSVAVTFAKWKKILDDKGIKAIKGSVVGDPRFFGRPFADPSWQAEDLGCIDGAGPSGLNFFGNSQVFTVSPGPVGKAPKIELQYPDTPWMNYVNSAVTSASGTANTIYYLGTGFGPFGEFHGQFPSGRREYKYYSTNFFGSYTCAYFFCNYLISFGIPVDGGYADISPQGNIRTDLLFSDVGRRALPSDALQPLGVTLSPQLWEIVRDTNFESNNFYAETLFNMLSAKRFGKSNRDLSDDAAMEMLTTMGLRPAGACVIRDGSGLSRKNYVSAEFFVRFLRRMHGGPVRDYFIASLPGPGQGTLKYRLANVPSEIKKRVRMKSGSMNGVLCFSGYILPEDGNRANTIYFSMLTNNVAAPASTVGPLLEDLIVSLAGEQ